MKVSEDSKKEVYQVLAMYYEAFFSQAIEKFRTTGENKKILKVLENYEMNVLCILNYLLRGKKRINIKANEAEDRFIKPEVFRSGLTDNMDKDFKPRKSIIAGTLMNQTLYNGVLMKRDTMSKIEEEEELVEDLTSRANRFTSTRRARNVENGFKNTNNNFFSSRRGNNSVTRT